MILDSCAELICLQCWGRVTTIQSILLGNCLVTRSQNNNTMPDSSGGSGIGQVSLNRSQFTWAQREPGFTGIRSHYHTIFEVWVTSRLLQGEVQNRNYSSGVDPLFFAHLPNIDCFTHVHMFFKKKNPCRRLVVHAFLQNLNITEHCNLSLVLCTTQV